MTQSIVVQVGQCGNQVGCRFWDLALREHAQVNKRAVYDEALGSFFRNVDSRYYRRQGQRRSRTGSCDIIGGRIHQLKARAVLVDMEEGVVNQIVQGSLRDLFDTTQLVTDVSGSGNNWAVGHMTYGSTYREQIVEKVRRAAEHCDCLQCFFLIHSMGGGTGSGLGTRVLGLLEEEFPEVCRIITSVYPSEDDDVITSPYNSVLAMRELTEHAHCVLPVENQSLVEILTRMRLMCRASGPGKTDHTLISSQGAGPEKPFDSMNNIIANLLLNITSSARFEGCLNMDLNEISMNLVPFPRLHYLVPSMSPLCSLADCSIGPRRLDQMFSDVFSTDHQLIRAAPKHSLYLACALLGRGDLLLSDIRRNIQRVRSSLSFVSWNPEGWKTSLCSVAPVGHARTLLALANNTCVKSSFTALRHRYTCLYRKKAHLHHYLQEEGMELSLFSQAEESLSSLIEEYDQLDRSCSSAADAPRLQIAP